MLPPDCTSSLRPLLAAALLLSVVCFAATSHAAVDASTICPRFAPGAVAAPPAELHSSAGVLEVSLHIRSAVDDAGLTRYCYVTDDGAESPTLRVHPGDKLIIHFHNDLPASDGSMATMAGMQAVLAADDPKCSAMTMTPTSTNLHFHGMNVSPTCHLDEVIHTLLQPGDSFEYSLDIPANEPSGMYWYHPHPHGFSEMQTQGGATGAIIVEGIENTFPALATLPERSLVLRDQLVPTSKTNPDDPDMPAWDLSVNFVPVLYPSYTPAVIETLPAQQEFWRVSNQAADLIYDLELVVNGAPVPVQIYAIDGVPVTGSPLTQTELLLPPGSRIEFVVTTPGANDTAQLTTRKWDTGPDGDLDPQRTIAQIKATANAATLARLPEAHQAPKAARRFANLAQATPTVERKLTFSEESLEGEGETDFYITVAGQVPALFDMNQAPNIVVHQGTVEDWTIVNEAQEDHVFHIHQIHFQVLEVDGQPITDPALRDTYNLPHWSGSGAFPSVKLRMDFRDSNIVGTFPYHCHILEHEDGGMMGLIQVLPPGVATTTAITPPLPNIGLNSQVNINAVVTPEATASAAPAGTMQYVVDDGLYWQAPVTNGQATLTTNLTSTGTHTFIGIYQGDTNYSASQSQKVSVNVPPRNFILQAAGGIAISAGSTGSVTLSVIPVGGFNDIVFLSCALPETMTGATCTLTPTSINGSGQTLLQVTTTAAKKTAAAHRTSTAAVLSLIAMPFGFAWIGATRKTALTVVLPFAALALLMLAASCGGGSKPPTPTGSYTLTVTGRAGITTPITSQIPVVVNVQ